MTADGRNDPTGHQSSGPATPETGVGELSDPDVLGHAAPSVDIAGGEDEMAMLGQWKLMWIRFKRHRLAMVGVVLVAFFYFLAIFAEFLSPQSPHDYNRHYPYAPPQRLHLFLRDGDQLRFRPHVYGYTSTVDPASFRRTFAIDDDQIIPVRLLPQGPEYRMWNLIPMSRRLFGPVEPGAPMFLLGADRLGRDLLTRIVYGARVSMTIGLVGVAFSLIIGIIMGGISGYFGGVADNIIQRTIEFLQSIPQIPLWMGLAAAIPQGTDPLLVYFLITVILSVLGWTGLARVVRGRFYSLKTEDFVIAARVDGCSSLRIIMRHMVPSFLSHIIATVTLAVPTMIIAETSLSFLGLGLRPPVVSWGVLLQAAQSVQVIANFPWLLLPGLGVFFAVLGFNFLGDGLRDAADPYATG